MYLLDTCVFSEFAKPEPSPKVLEWARTVKEAEQHLSILVLGELLRGVARMPDGERRRTLGHWIESLFETHGDRLVPVDAEVMRAWAELCAQAEASGKTQSAMDSLIAAQAISRKLTLVTRNTEDFRFLGVALLNPWESFGGQQPSDIL